MSLKVNREFDPIEFQEVKAKLKEFLKQQDEFKDYNFEGANMAVLLDVMAYSIHYLLFYLNMTINEFFLEYTSIKDNAITLAKSLGYLPRRKISSNAKIKLNIDETEIIPDENRIISVPMYSRLSANGLNFLTMEDIQITHDGTEWECPEINVKQGVLKELVFSPEEEFPIITLPDAADNIENSFLFLRVNQDTWIENTKIPDFIDATSRVYFLTRISNRLRISFGDGTLGRKVPGDAIIRIFYILSDGILGNLESPDFSMIDNLFDNQGNIISSGFEIEITQKTTGGSEEEGIESIKINAPKAFSAQERAITKDDFDVILNREGYKATVWGGDEEFDIYSIPMINSDSSDVVIGTNDDYSLLNMRELGKSDFFIGGLDIPYFSQEIAEEVKNEPTKKGFMVSEVNDDMVWEIYNTTVGEGDNLLAPLEDVTQTYWNLTHKPRIGYVFFCGYNVDAEGNKIQFTSLDINNFKSFMSKYKPITLKMLPFNPNIIEYNFDIRIKRDITFIGNTLELLTNLKKEATDFFNWEFTGFNGEFTKSQLVDKIMSNRDIRYCDVIYTTSMRLFEPYLQKERMVVRLFNEIKPNTIKIYNQSDVLIARDDGDNKIYSVTFDPSDDEILTEVPSRIRYDMGCIEFLIDENGLDLDFINDDYIIHFEFENKEYHNIRKENYINEISDIDIRFI